jgi:hypothetical protein
MARELGGLVALNALLVAAGAGILVTVGWCRPGAAWRSISLSYLAGAAYVGAVGSLVLICGLALDRAEFVVLAALPGLAYAVRSLLLRGRYPPLEAASMSVTRVTLKWALPGLLIAAITVIRSCWQPLNGWDAFFFWTPKAEAIVKLQGLSAPFLRARASANYPQLVPSLESLAFRFMGRFDTTLVHVQFALLLLAFVGAIREVAGPRLRASPTAVILILIAVAPMMVNQTLSAYADVPVAIFTTLGALALWRAATG